VQLMEDRFKNEVKPVIARTYKWFVSLGLNCQRSPFKCRQGLLLHNRVSPSCNINKRKRGVQGTDVSSIQHD
jgi:hypothetical protein